MISSKTPRIEALDYLRGILAFSVMFYHYRGWSKLEFVYPFDQLLDRLGIYAVVTFYIISGASLAIVYSQRSVDRKFMAEYLAKRFLRIAPLFWLATTLTIFNNYQITPKPASIPLPQTLWLNYTLTFGWLKPNAYIATGAWSIGNELVFYSVFPFLLLALSRSRKVFAILVASSVLIGLGFSFYGMTASVSLAEQWSTYVNPLNQFYFFAVGAAIGVAAVGLRQRISPIWLAAAFVAAWVAFTFWPVEDGQIFVVTGFERILFSLLCFVLCYAVAAWRKPFHPLAASVLGYLGTASYSIYLLHPIIFNRMIYINRVAKFGLTAGQVAFGVAMPLSLIAAGLCYKFLEKPFMRLGKKWFPAKIAPKQDAVGVLPGVSAQEGS